MYFKITEYIQAFKSKIAPIPFLLRTVALCFLCFSLFIIAIIPFPEMNYTVNGVSMTYSDFMKTKAPLDLCGCRYNLSNLRIYNFE